MNKTLLGLVVAALGLGACSGGGGMNDAATSLPDGSAGDAVTTDAPSADVPAAEGGTGGSKIGTVTIAQVSTRVEGMSTTVVSHNASFYEGDVASTGCTEQAMGTCTITRCPSTPIMPTLASAGAVTITGGSGAPVTLTPGTNGMYTADTAMMPRWSTGDAVMVSAAGGAVPAFTGSVAFPATVTTTQPTFLPGTPTMVARASGFTVRWTSMGSGGDVRVQIGATNAMGAIVQCTFPIAAGTGTIPPGIMNELPAGDGFALVAAQAQQRVTAGAWQVQVTAVSTIASGTVTLQ